MTQSIKKSYTAAADPTTWVGRIVYESAPNTVALHNDPVNTVPIGTVERFFITGDVYEVLVCISGPSWVDIGEAAVDGEATFVTGGDDSGGSALDGRAVVASEGDFYVGRLLAEVDLVAGALARVLVNPGQLAQAAGT